MKHGINLENLDTDINLHNDFYEYACGGWKKAHPLKGEFSQFGTFTVLSESARDNVRNLIETLSEDPESKKKGTIAQKISDIYAMGMDIERRNSDGNAPIQPILQRVSRFNRDKMSETIAWLSMGLDSPFFGYGVGADPGNSNVNILHIMEAGLGLGDRDYYLKKNDTNDKIIVAYREYITKIMNLAGFAEDETRRISDTVLRIETDYARHKKAREERRDPLKSYNMMSIDELSERYSYFDWKAIFEQSGLHNVTKANVSSPAFMEFINGYVAQLSDEEIRDLISYGVVSSSTGVLSEAFYDADFELYSRIMAGVEEKKPLWKRAMALPNSMFGEAVGQLYVKKYFPEENKTYMIELVKNLRKSLAQHIHELPWMSETTKKKAQKKLDAMSVKIGYPDKWKDYSEIHIDPALSYQENILKAAEWFTKDNFSKMDKPVDKSEWHMTPQTVNAYYSPITNEICFPAGILQPPFFDITADDALNYGSIGVVIGHEMTHGFDDSGRKFDKDGNLVNWWTEDDETRFKVLSELLVKQFDAVEVAPGVHANGTFTLGENIADQGGLRIALTAYKENCKESLNQEIDGFNAFQRFYLSYAGSWASNIRPEDILLRTQNDPHSLGCNRVNITLRNITPFVNTFGIKEGDEMYIPESERVIIW